MISDLFLSKKKMPELHRDPFILITQKIDQPKVHVRSEPSIGIKRVKDIPQKDKIQSRAGVIVYTNNNGRIYFGLGIDTKYGAYADFSGGIKYSIEDTLTGAIREFNEESLGVFDEISKEQIENSLAIYSDTMMTILIYIRCNMSQISSQFENLVRDHDNPEMSSIVWMNKINLMNMVYAKDSNIMYYKLSDLLFDAYQEYGDFFCHLI